MPRFRPLHLTKAMLRIMVYAIVALLVVVGVVIAAIETGWVKNQIRRLIVSQANNYLTATLEIGRLEGSLLRGITLGDVRLSQDGQTIVAIDEVSVSYSIRELFEPGLIIRHVRLTKPHVVASRLADGRWNLAALIKRERRDQQRSGPGRPLHILDIQVSDGDVDLRDPLTFGDVHVPSRFAALNASLTFDYEPVTWKVQLANVTWSGGGESLSMQRLAGGLSNGPGGWTFENLQIQTPRSALAVSGRVNREKPPTTLDLHVVATRFAFQEWAGVLGGLRNIAIESAFTLAMRGPLAKLATDLSLQGNGGDIQLSAALDTTVPGWHGTGQATVVRVNLARWLNRGDRPSDITGHVVFDLDFDLGRHFPKGSYDFAGPHVAYIGYEMTNFKARGTLTPTDAVIADASGTAYGSSLHITSGSIGIDAPYAYHFVGADAGMNLTKLPREVPLTHVDSRIALDRFDVTGQFAEPIYIKGSAEFGQSTYLGASIAPGTTGTIDTSVAPVRYGGEGNISALDINHFGEALDVDWMKDPRWAGVIAGHFRVEGAGGAGATMTLDGGGRLARAEMFDGRLSDADVAIHIANGSLTGSYNGRLETVDTAKAFADPRFAGVVTGTADASFSVRDLMVRATTIDDYEVDGTLTAQRSTIRGIPIDRGSVTGTMKGSSLDVKTLETTGAIDARGAGLIEFDGVKSSHFTYQVGSGDLSLLDATFGQHLIGTVTSNGVLTGPTTAMHLTGSASVDNLDVAGTSVLSTTADYDATIPWDAPTRAAAKLTGSVTEIYAAGREIPSVDGSLTYDNQQIVTNMQVASLWPANPGQSLPLVIDAAGVLRPEAWAFDLSRLQLSLGDTQTWQLTNAATMPTMSWTDAGFETTPLEFALAANATQRISVSGSWRNDGRGLMRLTGSNISLDALTAPPGRPARYGGTLDFDATVRGTNDRPLVSAQLAVTDGRVRKLSYQRLAGRVDYENARVALDLRLDQSAGVWLTVKGSVPASLVTTTDSDEPLDLQIASSTVGLGLIEGITDVVQDVTGQIAVNMKVAGTAKEPHFTGDVTIDQAGFVVSSSGARYKNGRASFALASDRVNVSMFHLEDRNGRTLDVSGSLGTRALSVGDIHIDARARRFEVLHNDTGSVEVNTDLTLRGDLRTPRIAGDITILGGDLKVDRIFERALFQPYATEETTPAGVAVASVAGTEPEAVDALAALNPWERLGLDIAVHSRGTLRLTGDNVQVTQGTPLGLGSFNLRATGDLYLYKDPGQPVYPSGSFDSITGSYAFQGRRFEVDPTSSINFRGDFNPEIFVTVSRVISGVDTRVTIAGNLQQPELRLSSTPPLEASDILSLIVFNTSASELSATQQQALAVRAGTLAYGFVATPLVSALQRSLGLDTLEIAPPTATSGYGPTITIGNELAPGLVAQFTRAFGQEAYSEATIEYYLSRILRIRATFSDAQSLALRDQPFRRVERAGIDLLFYFSF